MRRFLLFVAITALGSSVALGQGKTGAAGAREAMAPTLAQMLTFALEDEGAARAEYLVVLKKWPAAKPFSNILRAEENHIRWLLSLFQTHQVKVPAQTISTTADPTDWSHARTVGAAAEVANIAMYESFLRQDVPDDVRTVFQELKKGSENHLRATGT